MTTITRLPFGPAEAAVADLILRRAQIDDPVLGLAASLAVWSHRSGHQCVHLDRYADLLPHQVDDTADDHVDDTAPLPSGDELRAALRRHPSLVRAIDTDPGTSATALADPRPFVLVGDALFTQRQFVDELSIAERVSERLQASALVPDPAAATLITTLLGTPSEDNVGPSAATSFLTSPLTVLTGGPGTGKTYTLTRCLAAIITDARARGDELLIGVCAPTGKAARRAKELLDEFVSANRSASASHTIAPEVLDTLAAVEPRTMHRLLASSRGQRTRFAHHSGRPLPYDVVVVDEVSMVSAQLMARFLEALRPDTRVLLVGDPGQLESIEAGSVLRDLVDAAARPSTPLTDRVFELTKVHRQQDDSIIPELAKHVRTGHVTEAERVLGGGGHGVTFIEESDGSGAPRDAAFATAIASLKQAAHAANSTEPADHHYALALAAKVRILCGPRNGPRGIHEANRRIGAAVLGHPLELALAPGTPLLVTVNAPRLHLVNGDIGLVVRHPLGLRVIFDSADGPRYLAPAELPDVEVCFAMTIHKSQGSEYDHVHLVLPSIDSPLLTRELVYTALTRAKKSVTVTGSAESFRTAVRTRSLRSSYLVELLAPAH
jgi:exodeoxyribonuclease V alpha subunit